MMSLNIDEHKIKASSILYTGKTFEGKTFAVFTVFLLNRKCFPMNYVLVNRLCKSTNMLLQTFSREWKFCTLTAKGFPLESFTVYGNTHYTVHALDHLINMTLTSTDLLVSQRSPSFLGMV